MTNRDQRLRDMLRDLGKALSTAISDSPEVGRSLRKIRNEGYSLHLLLDCKRDPKGFETESVPAARTLPGEPVFQINARDLSFLRSIGIDPTRRLRRRRS